MTFDLDQSIYFDAEPEPLGLSRRSFTLDGFEFNLDDDADSHGSSVMEELLLSRLSSAQGSDTMDCQESDNLSSSLTNMWPFDHAQSEDSIDRPARGTRSSRKGPASRSSFNDLQTTKRVYALSGSLDFEPPAKRRTSQDDISRAESMCSHASYATAKNSHDFSPLPNSTSPDQLLEGGGQAQYSEALRKLAESMQRTEESRRHVLMQRRMLTPEQQRALTVAKEQLRQQTQLVAQQSRASHEQPHRSSFSSSQEGTSSMGRSLSPGRLSIMDAFFSGSKSNLTNGLDQSRTQLGVYMGQMNQRTLWG